MEKGSKVKITGRTSIYKVVDTRPEEALLAMPWGQEWWRTDRLIEVEINT